MADEAQAIRGINWREAFPFTHLFRAFRIAMHPSKLVLGLIALLSLYVGGRVLDGIWSARSLAVPGEVSLYQSSVADGSSSDEFIAKRLRRWDAIESDYADHLVAAKLVPNKDAGLAEARNGGRFGDLKRKILENRDSAVTEAHREHDLALKTAAGEKDAASRDKMVRLADEAFRYSMRNIAADAHSAVVGAEEIKGDGLFHSFFIYEATRINDVISGVQQWNWLGTAKDERGAGVVDSVINFFRMAPIWLMRHHPVYFVLFTLWFLTVWAIFGGAIARIAAVHVARDEKLSVRAALAFSLGKFLSFVSAPLIPLLIVLVVGIVPLLAGLLSSIWFIGPVINVVMTALFVIVLAAGFVMTLVLLGTFGGFNLMYPTIAVEGSDSFDAISRSFSYVYARPWRMLFYTLISIIYGAFCYTFVRLFIWVMLSLTHYFVGAGYFGEAHNLAPLWTTMWPGPQHTGTLSYGVDWLALRWDQCLAAIFLEFWVYVVIAMLGAFVVSFYFSANTIIYYLMRNEVDATEMDDVYVEQADEDFTDTAFPVATASAAAVGAVIVDTKPPTTEPPKDQPPA